MRKLLILAVAGSLAAVSTAGWAQSDTVKKTPGHMMKNPKYNKNTGPGASDFAPGHLKRKGESASKYTPSHRRTTGSGGRAR